MFYLADKVSLQFFLRNFAVLAVIASVYSVLPVILLCVGQISNDDCDGQVDIRTSF